MATIYIPDSVLMEYASEYGSPSAAKERIQEVVKKNSPGESDA